MSVPDIFGVSQDDFDKMRQLVVRRIDCPLWRDAGIESWLVPSRPLRSLQKLQRIDVEND